MMDRALARSYRERWKAVDEFIATERAAITPGERLRQIGALYGFARWASCGKKRTDDSEVRNRWVRLKERFCETRSS